MTDPSVTGDGLIDDANGAFAVVLAGPSGVGKTSLRDKLLEGEGRARLLFSVSMTTRAPRPKEREGEDYRFVDSHTFERLVSRGEMLEHALVHGDYYGTPRSNLDEARRSGRHLLLDIDVQGARQVRERVPGVVSIFVLPPSVPEMLRRLRRRGSETDEQLKRRYSSALSELEALPEFDYVVINDVLEDAVAEVQSILEAETRVVPRMPDEALAFAERLKGEIERRMQ